MKSFLNKLIILFLTAFFCLFFFSLFLDYELKTVVSGSMEPEISVGSLVIITPEDNLRVGDVITFQKRDALITHRIVAKTNGGFITAGDANDAPDKDSVDKKRVLGKVFFVIPLVGYFIEFIQTPLGFTVFIFIGLLIILIEEILETDENS